MLSVSQLCKSYGERRAVDGVSFNVQRGQTVGLLGPNGAGKSTTVSMICGLIRSDSGAITFDGEPVGQGMSAAKRHIGLVPQDLALYEELSAIENLKLFGALYGLKGAALKQRCHAVLELVRLADRAGEKPATFSGGMKRRLNIAAALLHDPQLLILDEPTVGVDPQSRNAIFDTLEALKAQGRSLIYTSHYMEEVERLADHIVIIDHGKVLADESPDALYRRLPAQAALRAELADWPAAGALDAASTSASESASASASATTTTTTTTTATAAATATATAGTMTATATATPADAGAAAGLVQAVARLPGVTSAALQGNVLDVGLADTGQAASVVRWLSEQGHQLAHFATARTNLEDIFLSLTGRSLRD